MSADTLNAYSKARRADLRARGLCISNAAHGKGDPRCPWCQYVHRHGIEVALTSKDAPPRPHARYVPRIQLRRL